MIKSKDVTGGGKLLSSRFPSINFFFYHYQNLKEHELKKMVEK